MQSLDGRIVVMQPGALAAGAIIRGTEPHAHQGPAKELIAGHTMMLFLARGEGTYRIHNHAGVLRPNTLLVAPAGAFACELSDERELYVVAVREPVDGIEDKHAFSPFIERRLSTSDGRRWKDRLEDFAERATAGRIVSDDVQGLRDAVHPYVWRREPNGARETLTGVFKSIWNHIAEPLTLERLATGVGYTANYLNDRHAPTHGPRARQLDCRHAHGPRPRRARTHRPAGRAGRALAGYDDPAYFSRAFRRAHGVPPATWRIAMRPVDARYGDVTIPIELLQEMNGTQRIHSPCIRTPRSGARALGRGEHGQQGGPGEGGVDDRERVHRCGGAGRAGQREIETTERGDADHRAQRRRRRQHAAQIGCALFGYRRRELRGHRGLQ